jgi:acetyltransferase-like isoleucine patch superfamily enzyme
MRLMIPLADPTLLNLSSTSEPAASIHPRALVEAAKIGPGASIGAFAHVQVGACVGRDATIEGLAVIESKVRIGDRATVSCGVCLRSGTEVEDDVFIGPNVTLATERSRQGRGPHVNFEGVTLRRGCTVGAGAVLMPGVEIGEGATVEAGAVVLRSVQAFSTVAGNPAKEISAVAARPRPKVHRDR